MLMDSEKVFDALASWEIERPARKDVKSILSFSLIFKITIVTDINEKWVNTAALHYIQVNPRDKR